MVNNKRKPSSMKFQAKEIVFKLFKTISMLDNFSCISLVIKKSKCCSVYDYKKFICKNYKCSLILFIKQKQYIFQYFELPGCYAITVKHKKPFETLKGLNA